MEYIKCPTHESSQSGFNIMKFMREIIKNPNMLTRDDEPFPQSTYEQDEIDEVRLEWVQTVNEALP
ncbi:hypothetical protein C5167_033877 [Papaver somniferum]|uniref:Uncharacterized protein n=1 Tax=Papaver somniferum TaxID=3469 RepID=A0A4Y7KEE9_PAPSO|nr:hypothetical protein C5167_033877 [Papaver somniferum]